jgi:FixJ family two-component response regulator
MITRCSGQVRLIYRAVRRTASEIQMSQKGIVAILEDDPVMRQAIAALISSLGYQAQSYASASEFRSVAATIQAACLLIDVHLGPDSGIALSQELVAGGFNFPIVVMTGSGDEGVRRRALDAGAVAFLLKPFRADDLISALSKATGSR